MAATASVEPQTFTFDPVLFSDAENTFLFQHVGHAPAVAFAEGLPPGVNRAAVKPMLEMFYDLQQLEEVRGQVWAGADAVKATIETYKQEQARAREIRRRGGPGNPSMYAWDSFGKPHRGGVGSDAGRVHTYIDGNGERHRFALELKPMGDGSYGDFTAPWIKKASPKDIPTALIEDETAGFVQCPVCKHTETYEQGSSSGKRMARVRMSNHMKAVKRDIDLHRAVRTNVFGS
jgi:hypothetical protein